MIFYLNIIILTLLTLIPILVSVAFYTLAERKIMASIQRRKGPNVIGVWGILQPFADALKLIVKELIYPTKSNSLIFFIAPAFVLFFSLINWALIPMSFYSIWIDLEYSILYFLVVSALSVYGIFLAGWASNSKYALLGGIRAIAQLISYEITISLVLLPVIGLNSSFNLIDIVYNQNSLWLIFPCLPLSIIFFIAMLAETNRTPFDLAEAEAELVAGYNIEYSSIIFAAFFLGEYANMLLMSILFSSLFLGGWLPNNSVITYIFFIISVLYQILVKKTFININIFISIIVLLNLPIMCYCFKTIFIAFLFIFVRSNLPRYRFDQLMFIGWKIMIPLSFGLLLWYIGYILAFNKTFYNPMPAISYRFLID